VLEFLGIQTTGQLMQTARRILIPQTPFVIPHSTLPIPFKSRLVPARRSAG